MWLLNKLSKISNPSLSFNKKSYEDSKHQTQLSCCYDIFKYLVRKTTHQSIKRLSPGEVGKRTILGSLAGFAFLVCFYLFVRRQSANDVVLMGVIF